MSLHIKEWQWKMHGYVKGLKGCHVKAPYMTPRDYMRALLNTQRTVQAFRAQIAENSKATAMLVKKQIATERERDNARAALAEAQKLNATLRGDIIHADAHAALMTEKRDDKIRQIDRIKESWDAVFEEKERLIKQLTAMTAERDALTKGINDTIDELQAGKISSIPGAPRTEWGVGCDAGKDKAIQILIRRTK